MRTGGDDVVQRLLHAINEHDLDAFVACFDAGYRSEQPVHPARTFRGSEQVRKELVGVLPGDPRSSRRAADEATEWGEWHWHGTRAGGSAFDMRGVTVMGVRNNHIVWGRLYMEGGRRSRTGHRPGGAAPGGDRRERWAVTKPRPLAGRASTLDSTVSLHRTRPNRFVTARVPAYLASGRLLREEFARPCCRRRRYGARSALRTNPVVELGGFVHLSLIQAEASHPDALAMPLH
jgi:ketosteroid isomerase-like protein